MTKVKKVTKFFFKVQRGKGAEGLRFFGLWFPARFLHLRFLQGFQNLVGIYLEFLYRKKDLQGFGNLAGRKQKKAQSKNFEPFKILEA